MPKAAKIMGTTVVVVELTQEFPRYSWPAVPTLEDLPEGYFPIKPTSRPTAPVGARVISSGLFIIDDEAVEQWQVQFPPLAEYQEFLTKRIDADAETARLKYITPGAGQAMTYQQKVNEAQRFDPDEVDPDPAKFPLLAAEIGITGATLMDVAGAVLNSFMQWQQIGAAIEAIRLGAKRDVDAAATPEDALAVYSAIVWP